MNVDLTLSSLKDKGYRLTKVRKEIVRIFSKNTKPLSANDIEKMLQSINLPVNKATIYREIQFLLRNGYIKEVYLYPNEVCYESSELNHHHHLVCEKCGTIDNVTDCLAKEFEEDIRKREGFIIRKHTLEFYGTCVSCAK